MTFRMLCFCFPQMGSTLFWSFYRRRLCPTFGPFWWGGGYFLRLLLGRPHTYTVVSTLSACHSSCAIYFPFDLAFEWVTRLLRRCVDVDVVRVPISCEFVFFDSAFQWAAHLPCTSLCRRRRGPLLCDSFAFDFSFEWFARFKSRCVAVVPVPHFFWEFCAIDEFFFYFYFVCERVG